eukprot:4715554-Prymnesium_polylepis.1
MARAPRRRAVRPPRTTESASRPAASRTRACRARRPARHPACGALAWRRPAARRAASAAPRAPAAPPASRRRRPRCRRGRAAQRPPSP